MFSYLKLTFLLTALVVPLVANASALRNNGNGTVSDIDNRRENPALDTSIFPFTQPNLYWTATIDSSDPIRYWRIDFSSAEGTMDQGLETNNSFVRCVRDVN